MTLHLPNGRKKGNVLFNDTLNTFYLRLYGVGHMVKDHSDNERGNLLPPHGLLFPISSKGSFICHTQDNTYHSLCYTSHGALAGTRNSSMGPPWRIDPTTHHTMSEHSYHRATYPMGFAKTPCSWLESVMLYLSSSPWNITKLNGLNIFANILCLLAFHDILYATLY